MKLTRNQFIDQFAISFHVHCLRLWKRDAKAPPSHISTCMYEWIGTSGGQMQIKGHEFAALMRPVIEELHHKTPKGQRPDAKELAGSAYTALDAVGVEVTLKSSSHAPSNGGMPSPWLCAARRGRYCCKSLPFYRRSALRPFSVTCTLLPPGAMVIQPCATAWPSTSASAGCLTIASIE